MDIRATRRAREGRASRVLATFLLVLALGMPWTAGADTLGRPAAHVASSREGRYYFLMIPARGNRPARGTMFEVRPDGEGRVRWTVSGWFASRVFVVDDGAGLIRLGDPPPAGGPSDEHLAISFYREGHEVRRYSTRDLIENPALIRHTESGYQFHAGFDTDPPRLVWGEVDGRRRWLFRLTSIDGITYRFDPGSGDIVERTPAQ